MRSRGLLMMTLTLLPVGLQGQVSLLCETTRMASHDFETGGLRDLNLDTMYPDSQPRTFTVSRVSGEIHGEWFGTETADSVGVSNPGDLVGEDRGWSFKARAVWENDSGPGGATQTISVHTWVERPMKPFTVVATSRIFDIAIGTCVWVAADRGARDR